MKDKPFIKPTDMSILTINSSSSSIKFALYKKGDPLERLPYGKIERIGLTGTSLDFNNLTKKKQGKLRIEVSDHKSVANFVIDWLKPIVAGYWGTPTLEILY
jgi:acetate kinase